MATKRASEFAVGSSVFLKFNGTLTEFVVAHQGNPSTSIYDASCDGTWLTEKNIASRAAVTFGTTHSYADSSVKSTLDGYYASFGNAEQRAIKQVKIPYRPGTGSSRTCNTLANGLPCKIFLLSLLELGFSTSTTIPTNEGARLDYFTSTTQRRGAYEYWTRTPYCNQRTLNSWTINTSGSNANRSPTSSYRTRMALIIDSGTIFDDATNTIALPAPENIRQTGKDYFSISLAWDAVSDASGYRVYRDGTLLATQTACAITDTSVQPSKEYVYSVEAYSDDAVSERVTIRAASKDGYIYDGVIIDSASLTPQQTTINAQVILSAIVVEETRILDPIFPYCGQPNIHSGEVIFLGNYNG